MSPVLKTQNNSDFTPIHIHSCHLQSR